MKSLREGFTHQCLFSASVVFLLSNPNIYSPDCRIGSTFGIELSSLRDYGPLNATVDLPEAPAPNPNPKLPYSGLRRTV